VANPATAINTQSSFEAALYSDLQLAVRQIIASEPIDSLLEQRPQMGARLMELAAPKAEQLGLALERVDVKDLTLPGELKKLFTQVTKARQEGLAALERARGETAALRNLANAARLVSDNPALMQLRLLQVVGEQSGNTVVLGMPSGATPVPISSGSRERIEAPPADAPDDG
jgi:regulator of protease activity HflC (stomatin/prohibitin superfamily)